MLTDDERRTLQVLTPTEVEILDGLKAITEGRHPHPVLMTMPTPCLCFWDSGSDSYVLTDAGRRELERLREKEKPNGPA